MSQVGIEILTTYGVALAVHTSLELIGKLDHMPSDLSYAGTRIRPRLKPMSEEMADLDRDLYRKHGKKNHEGNIYVDRNGHVVFENPGAEDAFLAEKRAKLNDPFTFVTYSCKESVIDELKAGKYEGGFGFLDALIGTVILTAEEETELKTSAETRKRESKELDMAAVVSDEKETPVTETPKGKAKKG